MRTTTIKVYKFEELKPKIQEKVLNTFREQEDFSFLEGYLAEELKFLLDKHKIKEINKGNLLYSLSYCQGDGLRFEGTFFYKGIYYLIESDNKYYYASLYDVKPFKIDKEGYKEDIENKKTKQFISLYLNLCKELEKKGYDYIELLSSDENIKDNIEINNYEFYEDGDIF